VTAADRAEIRREWLIDGVRCAHCHRPDAAQAIKTLLDALDLAERERDTRAESARSLATLATSALSRKAADSEVVRHKDVAAATGLSRVTIWRLRKAGAFVPTIKLGAHSVGYRRSDLARWLAAREVTP